MRADIASFGVCENSLNFTRTILTNDGFVSMFCKPAEQRGRNQSNEVRIYQFRLSEGLFCSFLFSLDVDSILKDRTLLSGEFVKKLLTQ